MIEVGTLKEWLGLFALFISVGSWIWMTVSSGSKKTATELAEFKKADAEEKKAMLSAITRLGERTQTLENEFRHMPDKDMVHKLQNDLTEVKGQVNSMVRSSEAAERSLHRLEDFLLERPAA